MPYFYNSDKNPVLDPIRAIPVISVSYPEFTLYKSELVTSRDVLESPYLGFQYNFTGGSRRGTFIDINSSTPTYFPSNVFIFKLLHTNIEGIKFGTNTDDMKQFVGELVIEHTSPATSEKSYVCFLLKSSGSDTSAITDIDKIIYKWPNVSITNETPADSITLNLQNIIDVGKEYINYVDQNTGNNVYVFLTPIFIHESSARVIAGYSNKPVTKMFSIDGGSGSSGRKKEKKTAKIGGASNVNTDDIYIDCQPTGVSGDEIQTYNLPINSNAMATNGQLDFMKMSINFFVFVLMIGVVYVSMPKLYYGMVINVVYNSKTKLIGVENQKKRIRSIDYFISFVLILTIIICFFNGFSSEQTELLTAGLFLFVIYILSFVLIQNKKKKEWKNCYSDDDKPPDISQDIFQFVGEGASYLLTKVSKIYIAIILVLFVLLLVVYATGSISSDSFSYAMTSASILVLPISLMIKLSIDYPNKSLPTCLTTPS
jgi:hypothetical protein